MEKIDHSEALALRKLREIKGLNRKEAGVLLDVSNKTVEKLEERLAHISTPMTLSVIGCVVNGPGEALMTDIGFTGGGRGTHQVYRGGVSAHRLQDENIVDHLVELVEAKAEEIESLNKKPA